MVGKGRPSEAEHIVLRAWALKPGPHPYGEIRRLVEEHLEQKRVRNTRNLRKSADMITLRGLRRLRESGIVRKVRGAYVRREDEHLVQGESMTWLSFTGLGAVHHRGYTFESPVRTRRATNIGFLPVGEDTAFFLLPVEVNLKSQLPWRIRVPSGSMSMGPYLAMPVRGHRVGRGPESSS